MRLLHFAGYLSGLAPAALPSAELSPYTTVSNASSLFTSVGTRNAVATEKHPTDILEGRIRAFSQNLNVYLNALVT